MSNAKKKRLAAFALCFLAWQALFIWLCTLGESVTIVPWFVKYVQLTEELWEWLLDAPDYGVLSSSAEGWTRLAVLVMRIAFIIIIYRVVTRRWKDAPRAERAFYAVLIAVFAVAYVLFTGSMVRNYRHMLEWHFLWQEAMDVELLSVAALLVIWVPPLLKMRPERQNNIA